MAEEVYFLYIDKWGYPPKQARHLLKFSKSINKKLTWKDAGELVKNGATKQSQTSKTDIIQSNDQQINSSQINELVNTVQPTNSNINKTSKIYKVHNTKPIQNHTKLQNIQTKSKPQPIKQNKSKINMQTNKPSTPILIPQSQSPTNANNDISDLAIAECTDINKNGTTETDNTTNNAWNGTQQQQIHQYQQQFPPPPPAPSDSNNTNKPQNNTVSTAAQAQPNVYAYNGYNMNATQQQQGNYSPYNAYAYNNYWNYYNNPQYAAYYQQQLQKHQQQQTTEPGQQTNVNQAYNNANYAAYYQQYQQQQQPQQQTEPGQQTNVNNMHTVQQQQTQQQQQQTQPGQQQQQQVQTSNKKVDDWNDHSNGLKGRDFLGMDVVKKYEKKRNQRADYSIPNATKPTVNSKKENKKPMKKKFKIFG